MTIEELVLERLREFDSLYERMGELTTEDYVELVKPLHEAILELAKCQNQTSTSEDPIS